MQTIEQLNEAYNLVVGDAKYANANTFLTLCQNVGLNTTPEAIQQYCTKACTSDSHLKFADFFTFYRSNGTADGQTRSTARFLYHLDSYVQPYLLQASDDQ
jgi:hypothetical protein